MCQFRNKGWAFYETMQTLMANGGATGHGARHSLTATAILGAGDDNLVVETVDAGPSTTVATMGITATDVTATVSVVGTDTPTAGGTFIVPRPAFASPSSSLAASTGKRTHTESTLPDVKSSDHHISSMEPALTTLISTQSIPARKKSRLTSSHVTGSGQSLMTSAARAQKITPATAVVGMQGSINRLAGILEQALVIPTRISSSEIRSQTPLDRAMHMLQNDDADLPIDQCAVLMGIFSSPASERAVEIYVQCTDTERRRAYVAQLLRQYGGETA